MLPPKSMKRSDVMKKWICSILAVCLVLILTSCGGATPEPLDADEVTAATVSTALYSSYLYVIEDRGAIRQLTELYNSLRYEALPDGEAPDILTDTLYTISFERADTDDTVSFSISPRGYLKFSDDYEKTYRLLSRFDEEAFRQLIEEYDRLQ